MFGAGAAGVGHVDMGIGAIGDQRVGMLDHFRRDVGMQVEADHQRNIVADHLSHAGEDFAFAVVVMLGHHRAVQVEIDRIELACRCKAVDHRLGDALEGVLGDMRTGRRRRKDRRDEVPTLGLGRLDETSEPHIDAPHVFQHAVAQLHARKPAAMDKGIIGRLGRRKRVGFVQEAADGDAGHSFLVLSSLAADVRLVVGASASSEALPDLHAASAKEGPASVTYQSLRPDILANRKGTDARKMGVGQFGLLGPCVERSLHLGEIALRFHFLRDIDAGIAQARHHIF